MAGTRVRERWERLHTPRAPRHRGTHESFDFQAGFEALGSLAFDGAQVSAKVTDLDTGRVLVAIDDRIVLPTASVGKILLLIEVAARITEREAAGYGILDKTPRDAVGDSGLWQHLRAPSLPLADLATLVAATSDNLATNVLLRAVGLDSVRRRTESLGLTRTALLDLVRDSRGPDDAPQLSIGSASELAWLFSGLARNEVVDPVTSSRVMNWLALNVDLSMVAAAFALDPLAHRGSDHGLMLVNKTGSDLGIRAEAGVLRGPEGGVAYAVSVRFADDDLATRVRVLDALRTVGFDLLEYVA